MGNGNSGSSTSLGHRYFSPKEAAEVIGHASYDKIRQSLRRVAVADAIDFNAFSTILQMRFDRMVF